MVISGCIAPESPTCHRHNGEPQISPEELVGIVEAAAERLDDEQKRSLESMLRMK
jgi:hypothetical protein